MPSPVRSPKSGRKGSKRFNSPQSDNCFSSKAQRLDAQVVARRQELRAEFEAAMSQPLTRADLDAVLSAAMDKQRVLFTKEVADKLAEGFDKLKVDVTGELVVIIEQKIDQKMEQLYRPGKLLVRAPPAIIEQLASTLDKALQDTSCFGRIHVDVIPRLDSRAAAPTIQLTEAGRHAGCAMADVVFNADSRGRVITALRHVQRQLGGATSNNFVFQDSLTKRGLELKKQRTPTFARLRNEENRVVRWVNGVDIQVKDDGVWRPYNGPWQPSNTEGRNGSAAGVGGSTAGASNGQTAGGNRNASGANAAPLGGGTGGGSGGGQTRVALGRGRGQGGAGGVPAPGTSPMDTRV
ncbi:hypothetical protein PLESTB_001079500 [Pleodorina starrii]|uniref:Uncharacterized protein n=1 Tax=Pleodorina starrii TaxID=330485 RepID=A0A9W6F4R9_9CHLO|nr:hypothetical protein PLESTB_001079500 [Pleodorina starrii]